MSRRHTYPKKLEIQRGSFATEHAQYPETNVGDNGHYLDLLVPEGCDEVGHGYDLGILLVRLGLLAVERVDL